MTTNNDEIVCECGHYLTLHVGGKVGGWCCVPCNCKTFTDARLAALRAEIARLTPTATRELPTKEGWYWRIFDGIAGRFLEPIDVRRSSSGLTAYLPLRQDFIALDSVPPGYWSAEPIPEMIVPDEKGGEG